MLGLAFYNMKYDMNFGLIMRAAYNFNADIIFHIGSRKYRRVSTDTFNTAKQIPIIHFDTLEQFLNSYSPVNKIVALEVNNSILLNDYVHPKNAIYLFGGEDVTLPKNIPNCDNVRVDTKGCLNLAMCVTVTLYDRSIK